MEIRTIYEDGYSWVEIEDKAWQQAEFMDYLGGYPLDYKR